MKPFLIAAIILLSFTFPTQAFTAKNGMTVTGTSATDFLVLFDAVPRETDYLCAAGDFVVRGLGLPSKTQLSGVVLLLRPDCSQVKVDQGRSAL